MTWPTSRKTPHFPSQSKLVRTSLGVNGNKMWSFCGKYNSKCSIFGLVKLPVWKIPWCSSHFFKKNLCSFPMTFTLDHAKSLLKSNSVYELRNAESVLCDRFKKTSKVTQTKLCESLTVTLLRLLREKLWSNETDQMLLKMLLLWGKCV